MTDYTWTGAVSNDSGTAANWSPSGVPGAADNVFFDDSSPIDCVWQESSITDINMESTSMTLEINISTLTVSGVFLFNGNLSVPSPTTIQFTGSSSVLIQFRQNATWVNGDTDKANTTFEILGTSTNIMFENGEYPIVKIGASTTVSPHVPSAPNNTFTETDFYQLTFDTGAKFAETSALVYASDPKEERNKVFRIRSIGTWSPERFEGGKAIWIFYATTGGFELPLSGSNISTATSFEGKVAQIQVVATAIGQKIKVPPGPHYLEKLTIDVGVMCICDRQIAELHMTNRPTIDGAWQFVQIADGIYRSAKEDMILPITHGGTGQKNAQDAINALTQVSAATNEYVLTKDTTTGDAIWKAAAGGGGGSSTLSGLTDTTITSPEEPQILVYDDASSTWLNDTNDRLFIRVYNDTASTLSKGKAVYITGFQNANVAKVELAKADSSATMPAVGVIWEDVAAGAEGYIVALGKANGIAANFTAGDTLYVSPTTAGELTNTRPTSTSHLVQNVGILFKPDASNAVMKVTGVGRTNDIPNQFSVSGTITASSLITSGGTSSDFVKGDGSLDSNTYLTSYTETDPIFSASAAAGISAPDITNWNTAYGWGDHSTQGYLTSTPPETDPIFAASEAALFAPGDAAKLAGIQAGAQVNVGLQYARWHGINTGLTIYNIASGGRQYINWADPANFAESSTGPHPSITLVNAATDYITLAPGGMYQITTSMEIFPSPVVSSLDRWLEINTNSSANRALGTARLSMLSSSGGNWNAQKTVLVEIPTTDPPLDVYVSVWVNGGTCYIRAFDDNRISIAITRLGDSSV